MDADPALIPAEARPALDTIRDVGGIELVVALLRTFVQYSDAQVAEAGRAATAGDASAVARIAHSLKSSAEQVGAVALADVCRTAELAHGGTDEASTAALVAGIRREYTRAREWMERVMGA
jgi:HPt (histidine-containing phosphotransfer) domain-containing protein